MFEQELELLKAFNNHMKVLESEMTLKYKGTKVLCWYDGDSFKRELTIKRVYFCDGIVNIHGVNEWGHTYTYSEHAHFKWIGDNE